MNGRRKDFKRSLAEKFDNRTNKTDSCWIWEGTKNNQTGYGQLYSGGSCQLAHRVSYELHIGPIPEGLFVCHHCDNPICVNPAHLYAGTQLANMADKSRRGRWRGGSPPGMGNHNAKLTDAQVLEIKALFRFPYFPGKWKAMGDAFGVAPCVIDHIKAGRSWRHIP